jgi:hypothetical protein
MAIKVSTEVKALFEAEAKALCNTLKVEYDSFNQELNAITTFRCIRAADKKWPVLTTGTKDEVAASQLAHTNKVLEILHKGGNSSANRQAISDVAAKKTAAATSIVADLLKPSS